MTEQKKASGWARWREKQKSASTKTSTKKAAKVSTTKKKKKSVTAKKAPPTASSASSTPAQLKQYVGISRDHSSSMRGLTESARKDYNSLIEEVKQGAYRHQVYTLVSTVLNGIGPGPGRVVREVVNAHPQSIQPITGYPADGHSTPLWDSVGELIELFEAAPDRDDPSTSFLVMVVTDGQENASQRWSGWTLREKIKQLHATDRWTFVFRVPKGSKATIIRDLGLHEGNVIEWDVSDYRELEKSTLWTGAATQAYFGARASGLKSSTRFYANTAAVKPAEVKRTLQEIKDKSLEFFRVSQDTPITDMIERCGRTYRLGSAFYQLTKTEDVQEHKMIAIRERSTGKTYTGRDARDMLGLPESGTIRLSPGNTGKFDVFVQSTSMNRKLIAGTDVMYWPAAARN